MCSARSSATACDLAHPAGGKLNCQRDALWKQFLTWEAGASAKGRRDTDSLSSGLFGLPQRRVAHIPFLNQILLGPQALPETGNATASYSATGHSAAPVPLLGLSFLPCKIVGWIRTRTCRPGWAWRGSCRRHGRSNRKTVFNWRVEGAAATSPCCWNGTLSPTCMFLGAREVFELVAHD